MNLKPKPELKQQLQLDAICMQFEEQLRNDRQPRIETFVQDQQEPFRSLLLRHLLQLEMEYRCEVASLEVTEYLDRFPQDQSLVHSIYGEECRRSSNDNRPDQSLSDTDQVSADTKNHPTSSPVEQGKLVEGVPHRISQYTIVRKIGQGGMGAVYEALQDQPRRSVAIKVLSSTLASEALERRFQFESQVLGLLKHPGIAQIYEAGTDLTEIGPRPFFVMELVDGRPLSEFVRQENLDRRSVLELIASICDAIHHAHQKGIVHRDLKPANILVDELAQPKILDFGIARTIGSDLQATMQTESGQIVGTLAYMSPEQTEGRSSDIDIRSDVYSLGVILYELLAAQPAFNLRGKSVMESLQIVRETQPPTLGAIDPRLSGDVATIVHTAMDKSRERRYQSAAEMAGDIRRYLANQAIVAHPPSTFYVLKKFAARNKLAVTAACLIMLALLAGFVGTSRQARIATEERVKAEKRLRYFEQMFQSVDPRSVGREARVADFLDSWKSDLQDDETLDTLGRARLLHSLGIAYYGVARYDESVEALSEALQIRTPLLGAESADVAESLTAMGLSNLRRGKYELAKSQLEEALRVHELLSGRGSLQVAKVLDMLGTIRWFEQDNDGAIRDLRRALAIHQQKLAPDDPMVIMSLHRLATTLGSVGEVDEALELVTKAMELAEQKWPGESLDKNLVEEKYADVLIYEHRWAKADEILTQLVSSNRRLLGEQHPDLAHTIGLQAAAKMHLGDIAEAFKLWDEALEIRKRVYGESHKEIAEALVGTAQTAFRTGRIDRARADAERAVLMLEQTIGARSRRYAEALEIRAACREWQHDGVGAITDQRQALEIFCDLYGEESGHPDVAAAYTNLGILYMKTRRFDEVEPNLCAGIAVAELDPRRNNITLFDAHYQLARLLALRVESRDELLPALQKTLELSKFLPKDDPTRQQTVARLGILLAEDGLFDRAIPYLEEANSFSDRYFSGTRLAARLRHQLGRTYAHLNKNERAEELLTASFIELERNEGSESPNVQQVRRELRDLFTLTNRPELAAEIDELKSMPPEPPQPLEPTGPTIDGGKQLELRLTPFEPPNRWVHHATTRWEISAIGEQGERQVVFDVVCADQLATLSLPAGFLRPNQAYAWRATYVASDSRSSMPSQEGQFETGDFTQHLQSIDLSSFFNRDVIASPHDPQEDTFDGDARGQLLAPAAIGESMPADTLPPEAVIGVHQLGHYGAFNAIQLSPSSSAIKIPIPHAPYQLIRLLLSGANGSSSIAVTLDYRDGTEQSWRLPCRDWYDDDFTQTRPPYAIPAINDLDRLSQGKLDDANDPAIFEVLISPDATKTAMAIRVLPESSSFANARSLANVFAITGVGVSD